MIKRGWKYLTQDHANTLEKLCKDGNADAINSYGKECTYIGTSNGIVYGVLFASVCYVVGTIVDTGVKVIKEEVQNRKLKKSVEEFAEYQKEMNEQNT